MKYWQSASLHASAVLAVVTVVETVLVRVVTGVDVMVVAAVVVAVDVCVDEAVTVGVVVSQRSNPSAHSNVLVFLNPTQRLGLSSMRHGPEEPYPQLSGSQSQPRVVSVGVVVVVVLVVSSVGIPLCTQATISIGHTCSSCG